MELLSRRDGARSRCHFNSLYFWLAVAVRAPPARSANSVCTLSGHPVGIGMRTGAEHSNIEKAAQFARVVRVLQLAERLGLDLPDSFAGYRELVSDLFQGMAIHPDAEAHAQDALLARRQACEHLGGGLTNIGLDPGIDCPD